MSSQLHVPIALLPGKGLDRRLGGSHSQSGRGGEKKKSRALPGIEALSSSS